MTSASYKHIKVPFKKLSLDSRNMRSKDDLDGILALAANIANNGVLQNLIVRPAGKRGRYLVTAGSRRYRAVEHLVSEGMLTTDYEIPCQVRTEEEAIELNLAENILRKAMSPVDQFQAFRALADSGVPVEDIAKRFGTTELVVSRRLRLARVSPVLLELYEKDELKLSQLQAFTVSDDHEAQVRVWNSLPLFHRRSRDIRMALTDGKIPASDKRIRYLGGLDVVHKAGGNIVRDLFSDQEGGYVEDVALVEKLVAEKIETTLADIAAEGWKWVRYQADVNHYALHSYGREVPGRPKISREDRLECRRLAKISEKAAKSWDKTGCEDARKRYETAVTRIKTLSEKYQPEYSDEQKAICGVIVSIGCHGDLHIERGLVDPKNKRAARRVKVS